jgi:hypothetical protein
VEGNDAQRYGLAVSGMVRGCVFFKLTEQELEK